MHYADPDRLPRYIYNKLLNYSNGQTKGAIEFESRIGYALQQNTRLPFETDWVNISNRNDYRFQPEIENYYFFNLLAHLRSKYPHCIKSDTYDLIHTAGRITLDAHDVSKTIACIKKKKSTSSQKERLDFGFHSLPFSIRFSFAIEEEMKPEDVVKGEPQRERLKQRESFFKDSLSIDLTKVMTRKYPPLLGEWGPPEYSVEVEIVDVDKLLEVFNNAREEGIQFEQGGLTSDEDDEEQEQEQDGGKQDFNQFEPLYERQRQYIPYRTQSTGEIKFRFFVEQFKHMTEYVAQLATQPHPQNPMQMPFGGQGLIVQQQISQFSKTEEKPTQSQRLGPRKLVKHQQSTEQQESKDLTEEPKNEE
ncbi:MAG: hypothetical protein EZS28_013490 [Streblomastix strix]|uniref:mRNA 5'-phosphatase n=1 Tax=Streblomastix strix TaxID=222440 RepID=A0A5J4W7Z7_9EUKA|nr:MAG: hypothetical protein EZS28_013490 [Streblomastix strix]